MGDTLFYRNKAVQVEVQVVDDEGKLKREKRDVKFINAIVADIEEEWDGLDTWTASLESKPVSTTSKTLGLMWGKEPQTVMAEMLEGQIEIYAAAVSIAWMRYLGVKDDAAVKKMVEGANEMQANRMEAIESLTSSGTDTSNPGSTVDDQSQSSGTTSA